jgi:hypothetical protein
MASEPRSAASKRKRRAWRTFFGFLFLLSVLEAPARYPNLAFHGFWGALPWPMYLGFAAGWAWLWWEAGRG